jgi:hypothetical protein
MAFGKPISEMEPFAKPLAMNEVTGIPQAGRDEPEALI